MYPYPAADLAPPALPAGLFSAESRNGPNQPKAFMCAGVDGPSPRIDLAPPQPLRMRGHFLWNPWIPHAAGPNGRVRQGRTAATPYSTIDQATTR